MRTIRLLFTFYKLYAATSIIISLACFYSIYKYELGISSFSAFFWFKIITLGLIYYYIHSYKNNEFYYYKNLGLTKKQLWISTLIFDFIIFLVLLTLAIKIT
jgi:hypothetical protein